MAKNCMKTTKLNFWGQNNRKHGGQANFLGSDIVRTPRPPWVMGEGPEPFFRTFIQEGLRSNWGFGWELGLQVGVIFFSWDLKTPCVKNSEYKSQARKIIPIVISSISHFWSPIITNLWQSVFVSLFSIVYTPPYPQIFFS